jgi:ABC-type Fe3+ transport system permease subunit
MPSDSASGNNGSRPYAEQTTVQRVIAVGYILAVAMPPLGLGVGLVLMLSARLRSKHGPWIVLISIVAAAIWTLMISAGALKDTSQGY